MTTTRTIARSKPVRQLLGQHRHPVEGDGRDLLRVEMSTMEWSMTPLTAEGASDRGAATIMVMVETGSPQLTTDLCADLQRDLFPLVPAWALRPQVVREEFARIAGADEDHGESIIVAAVMWPRCHLVAKGAGRMAIRRRAKVNVIEPQDAARIQAFGLDLHADDWLVVLAQRSSAVLHLGTIGVATQGDPSPAAVCRNLVERACSEDPDGPHAAMALHARALGSG